MLREELDPSIRAVCTLSWDELCLALSCQTLDSSLQHPQLYAIKLYGKRKRQHSEVLSCFMWVNGHVGVIESLLHSLIRIGGPPPPHISAACVSANEDSPSL